MEFLEKSYLWCRFIPHSLSQIRLGPIRIWNNRHKLASIFNNSRLRERILEYSYFPTLKTKVNFILLRPWPGTWNQWFDSRSIFIWVIAWWKSLHFFVWNLRCLQFLWWNKSKISSSKPYVKSGWRTTFTKCAHLLWNQIIRWVLFDPTWWLGL